MAPHRLPAADDMAMNISVLEAAHSIFAPWHTSAPRLTTSSAGSWTPASSSSRYTAGLFAVAISTCVRSIKPLLEMHYDFACQGLPPVIEDTHEQRWRLWGTKRRKRARRVMELLKSVVQNIFLCVLPLNSHSLTLLIGRACKKPYFRPVLVDLA